jgi:hypothetical protein
MLLPGTQSMAGRGGAKPPIGGTGWSMTTCSAPCCGRATGGLWRVLRSFASGRDASGSAGGVTRAPARPTVALARVYVELQRLERAPGPAPTAGVEGCAQLAVPLPPVPAGRGADGRAAAGPGRLGPNALGAAAGGENPGAASLVADRADVSGLGVAAGLTSWERGQWNRQPARRCGRF